MSEKKKKKEEKDKRIPISKKVLRMKIGKYYKENKVPRKKRTKYGTMNAAGLLNLAEKTGAVKNNKYRVYKKKTSHLTKIKKGQVLKKKKSVPKVKVEIGINDKANKGRMNYKKSEWEKNKKYYDSPGIDDGITVKKLKIIAKKRGIKGYSTLKKKQLVDAIAKTEVVKK